MLDTTQAVKTEVHFINNSYQRFYYFKCKKCDDLIKKYKYQLETASGLCKKCCQISPEDNREEKKCIYCNLILPMSKFSKATGNGKYDTKRKHCNFCNKLHYTYKIKYSDFITLKEKQENKCRICKLNLDEITLKERKLLLCIDHCHKTGKVRGLLCSNCNAGIGFFKDNIELLKSATLYLQEYDN